MLIFGLHKQFSKADNLNLWLNPNTFTAVVGKVQKNYLPKEGGREGGEKKAHAVRPQLEPRTYRMLGEGPQLHAMGVV